MMFQEYTIQTMNDFLTHLQNIRDKNDIQPIWFRGQINKAWDLIPSIQRGSLAEYEPYLVNDFYIRVKQVENSCPDKENYAAWMSLMQHYGLPTRILDWSESPLIALYFAIEKNGEFADSDACIWILLPRKINIAEGFGEFVYPMDAYTTQMMLVQAFKNVDVGENFCNKILACHSVEKDLRIYSQQANFTVHNTNRKLLTLCNKEMLYKFVIPKERKEYFYKNVKLLGITTSYIYPTKDMMFLPS